MEPAPDSPRVVPSPWGAGWSTFGPADDVRSLRIEGRVAEAVAVGRAALDDAHLDPVRHATLLSEHAAALVEVAEPAASDAVALAVAACTALPDTPESTYLVALATGSAAALGGGPELTDTVHGTLQRAHRWGLDDVEARAANTLGCLLARTDPARAREALEQSRRASERLTTEDPMLLLRFYVNAAGVLGESGRFEDAAALALEGLDFVSERGLRASSGAHLAATAVENLLADGDLSLARATLEPWLPRGEAGRDRWWLVALDGRLAVLRGDVPRARSCLDALDRSGGPVLPSSAEASRSLLRAELCAMTGPASRAVSAALLGVDAVVGASPLTAVELVVLAADSAPRSGVPSAWRRVEEAWSLLPPLHDDLVAPWRRVLGARRADAAGDDARPRWRSAEDVVDGRLPVSWAVRVALASAEAHAAWGSAVAARDRWGGAGQLVTRHGLAGFGADLGRVERVVASVEPPPAEKLTVREAEVLGLLATGAGNQAIAGRLGLSHRTVEVHVATILRKLMVTSRTAAAARARALGLLDGHDLG